MILSWSNQGLNGALLKKKKRKKKYGAPKGVADVVTGGLPLKEVGHFKYADYLM